MIHQFNLNTGEGGENLDPLELAKIHLQQIMEIFAGMDPAQTLANGYMVSLIITPHDDGSLDVKIITD